MQHRFSTVFSTAFFVFFFFTLSAAGFSPNTRSDRFGPCPAPAAPTGLVVTGVTTTSISIAWDGPDIYYNRIDVTDTDAGITYPSQQADYISFATITGLIAGHHHTIDLRRSTCAEGNYSNKSSTGASTAIIIVEKVIAIANKCHPSTVTPTSVGPNFTPALDVCVPPTLLTPGNPGQPVSNPYIGNFFKGGINVEYMLAYDNSNNRIWAHVITPDGDFVSYKFTNNPNGSIKCSHLLDDNGNITTTDLFTIGLLAMATENAYFYISFSSNGSHAYCGGVTCPQPGRPSGRKFRLNGLENASRSEQFSNEEILEQAITPPAPNPFTQSTTLRYQLSMSTQVSIQLFDAIGNLVQTVQPATPLLEGEYTATIQGANLPNGTYFAVVQKGSERQVFPLIRQE